MKYTYLASPYSHPDRAVMEARYLAVCRAAAAEMQAGTVVFCPIAHSHQIGIEMKTSSTHDFWRRADMPFLVHASEVAVLMLDGVAESRGTIEEVRIAQDLGIPVRYIQPKREWL